MDCMASSRVMISPRRERACDGEEWYEFEMPFRGYAFVRNGSAMNAKGGYLAVTVRSLTARVPKLKPRPRVVLARASEVWVTVSV